MSDLIKNPADKNINIEEVPSIIKEVLIMELHDKKVKVTIKYQVVPETINFEVSAK